MKKHLGPLLERHRHSIDIFRERADSRGGVIYFDVSDLDLEGYNKFIPYFLFPDALYSVGVSASPSRAKVSVGTNPWKEAPRGSESRFAVREIWRRRTRQGCGHLLRPGRPDPRPPDRQGNRRYAPPLISFRLFRKLCSLRPRKIHLSDSPEIRGKRVCNGILSVRRGSGGIGRRASLRSWWPKGRRGSSPFFRMIPFDFSAS